MLTFLDLGINRNFRVGVQGDLGIDVQGGGNAAWRPGPHSALKSIGGGVVAIQWSIKGRLEGWFIADETCEPIR